MISVVIPAYNEEKLIGTCLDSLAAQVTSKKFEIIVVNNNSTDKTTEIIKHHSRNLNVRVVDERRKGRGIARATGFRNAKGLIIFSTDSDAIVPHDWIEETLRYFENPRVIAVTG